MAKITISTYALLGLLLLLSSGGETRPSRPCCSQYSHPVPVDRIIGFSVDRLGTCRLNAVKFLMKSGRIACANPKEQWVIDAMNFIRNSTMAA